MTVSSGSGTTAIGDIDWPIPIAELADLVDMTPRNIRAHQSRGLLPPPVRRGRIACYGPEHHAILLRIKELQSRGYNLAAIETLLHNDVDEHGALQRLVLSPLLEHDEIILSWEAIAAMFDQTPDPERYRRAVESGIVTATDDGDLIAPSANLLKGARELIDMGVPFQPLFDLQIEVAHRGKVIASRFVEMCLECALQPYGEDVPPDKWDDVRERFETLYQLMTSVLAGSFSVNIRRAAEELLAERRRRVMAADDEAAGQL